MGDKARLGSPAPWAMRQPHFSPHAVNSISKMGILPVDPDVLVCQADIFIISNGNSTFSAVIRHFLVETSFFLQESFE